MKTNNEIDWRAFCDAVALSSTPEAMARYEAGMVEELCLDEDDMKAPCGVERLFEENTETYGHRVLDELQKLFVTPKQVPYDTMTYERPPGMPSGLNRMQRRQWIAKTGYKAPHKAKGPVDTVKVRW